jgi:hypothetical protein
VATEKDVGDRRNRCAIIVQFASVVEVPKV